MPPANLFHLPPVFRCSQSLIILQLLLSLLLLLLLLLWLFPSLVDDYGGSSLLSTTSTIVGLMEKKLDHPDDEDDQKQQQLRLHPKSMASARWGKRFVKKKNKKKRQWGEFCVQVSWFRHLDTISLILILAAFVFVSVISHKQVEQSCVPKILTTTTTATTTSFLLLSYSSLILFHL